MPPWIFCCKSKKSIRSNNANFNLSIQGGLTHQKGDRQCNWDTGWASIYEYDIVRIISSPPLLTPSKDGWPSSGYQKTVTGHMREGHPLMFKNKDLSRDNLSPFKGISWYQNLLQELFMPWCMKYWSAGRKWKWYKYNPILNTNTDTNTYKYRYENNPLPEAMLPL